MKLKIEDQIRKAAYEKGFPERVIRADLAKKLWPDSGQHAQYQSLRNLLIGKTSLTLDRLDLIREYFDCTYNDLIEI